MFRACVLASALLGASAVRLNSLAVSEMDANASALSAENAATDEELDAVAENTFLMLEDVYAASGRFRARKAVDEQDSAALAEVSAEIESGGCPLVPELQGRLKDGRCVGMGAGGCVWVGTENGVAVAVKISRKRGSDPYKRGGTMSKRWRRECEGMQKVRKLLCQKGGQEAKMAEMYIPTCTEVGDSRNGYPYLIMHSGGKSTLKSFLKSYPNVKQQKRAFAQMVAAVHVLHSVGYGHNDLHGGNAMMLKNKQGDYDLSLIDFGPLAPLKDSKRTTYRRDANAIWRWGAAMARCDEDAQYMGALEGRRRRVPQSKPLTGIEKCPFKKCPGDLAQKLKGRSERALQCFKAKWGVGKDFESAFRAMTRAAKQKTTEQHVTKLYKTKFIQKNLPPVTPKYVVKGLC